MSEERKMVLEMLKEGKIDNDEALKLLDALGEDKKKSRIKNDESASQSLSEGISKLVNKALASASTALENMDFDYNFNLFEVGSKNIAKTHQTKNYSIAGQDQLDLYIENRNGLVKLMLQEDEDSQDITCQAEILYNDSYFDEDDDFIEIKRDAQVLIIQIHRADSSDTNNVEAQLLIKVPKRLYESIRIITSNAKIHVSSLESNLLHAKTTNGRIVLSNSQVNKIKLKSSNGSLDLKNVEGDFLEAKTTNGRVHLDNMNIEESVITTSNGKILVDKLGDHVHLINAKTSNGNIQIKSLDFSRKIKAVINRLSRHISKYSLSDLFTQVNDTGKQIIASNTSSDNHDIEIITSITNGNISID